MRRALELAERGRGHTAPNPVVGAVLVRDARVVGEGWHKALGAEHAETMALRKAGRLARGATLYVTLEPCAHWGRTPPCADALVEAGIRRCVAALRDPDPRVNGRGFRRLRAAGVRTEVGLEAGEARERVAGYLRAHATGLPRITWKVAASLDGRVADARGRSRWITGPAARADAHRLRATSDAILVGSGTARADDPRLTARTGARSAQPLRVVVDSALRLPLSLRLYSRALAGGTVVACTEEAPEKHACELTQRGVRVWRTASAGGRVNVRALARRLAREGCHEVLLEGGPTLGSAFLRAGLVQRLVLHTAPRVLGGGRSWCEGLDLPLPGAIAGTARSWTRLGDDTCLVVDLEG